MTRRRLGARKATFCSIRRFVCGTTLSLLRDKPETNTRRVLVRAILRLGFAAAPWRVLVVDAMGGTKGAPQQSRDRKNNKAAENKYDGKCNNVGMFKRPNHKGVHADN